MNRLSLKRPALKNFTRRCCDKNDRKVLLINCRESWRCALHLSCTVKQLTVSCMYICDELNGSVSLQLSGSVSLCFCDGLLKISWNCKPLVKSVDGQLIPRVPQRWPHIRPAHRRNVLLLKKETCGACSIGSCVSRVTVFTTRTQVLEEYYGLTRSLSPMLLQIMTRPPLRFVLVIT